MSELAGVSEGAGAMGQANKLGWWGRLGEGTWRWVDGNIREGDWASRQGRGQTSVLYLVFLLLLGIFQLLSGVFIYCMWY